MTHGTFSGKRDFEQPSTKNLLTRQTLHNATSSKSRQMSLTAPDICGVVTFRPSDFSDQSRYVDIPVPLPEYVEIDEYVAKAGDLGILDNCSEADVRSKMKDLVLTELDRLCCLRDDAIVEAALQSGLKDLPETEGMESPKICSNRNDRSGSTFADHFSHIMHNSPTDHLLLLMRMEVSMEKEMSRIIRARTWEVDQLTKECEVVLCRTDSDDMHPHQLSKLNEKLRQVHGSYGCQIEALVEQQRQQFRDMVEAIYSAHGSVLKLPESLSVAVNEDSRTPDNILTQNTVTEIKELDESFTIYIGAQLKSMQNIRILTSPDFVSLCTPDLTSDLSSRLQMSMCLYSRSLAGMVLLVSKNPFEHTNNRTEFARVCERSTDMHFGSLASQLKDVSESTLEANGWRCSEGGTSTFDENGSGAESKMSSGRNDSTLAVGDVYCTKHSNLRQVQIVFHLVVDEQLQSSDISSRHPCLNGIRNVIRLTARLGVTTIFIPLLLIERPSESTTVAWCIKRAEMVYKCVKGYLMEVCGSASSGASTTAPHYNINFVLPSGLSPSIYHQIVTMLPTIFHLVPGVSAQIQPIT